MILHPQLEKDCFVVGQLPLCAVLLMNDSNYPWFILVPQREGVTEIHQLPEADQQQLIRESCMFASVIEKEFGADKINIAALGNMVPQLHIHHIVRYKTDPAWPAPVWGKFPASPYDEERSRQICEVIGKRLLAT
ncbi:Diadenosine tetraphosphate (Ap4A) hydrolase [Mariprofundus ferrinatatus]|uniref:Diadenosine tetraphosphate (Ap4A) hydrolase n=1 Tax=Mariprofundus ferrinatatus TaxID=1921087 RepID=A0A2K8L1V6_9PROT|nr:HIT domain-containing protein [Mariprofundus ferrinatatus]ATX81267.1 Diadenosine tetraphosphate (Ap4A) hydrolase [Mariprofundus ferrinatatus]